MFIIFPTCGYRATFTVLVSFILPRAYNLNPIKYGSTDYKKLVAQQEARAAEINRIQERFNATSLNALNINIVKKRIQIVDKIWDEARETHAESPRLTNVTKLQYLRSSQTNNAADFVKNVLTTDANYLSTWKALKARFSNPRLTVNNHLTELMSLPYLKKESANELQSFSDDAQRIVRVLKNLDMPVQHWDIWLVYLLASRLDPDSRKLWESQLRAKDRQAMANASASGTNLSPVERFASFDDFVDFLDQRTHALCMIASETKINKSTTSVQSKTSNIGKRSIHTRTIPGLEFQRVSTKMSTVLWRSLYRIML